MIASSARAIYRHILYYHTVARGAKGGNNSPVGDTIALLHCNVLLAAAALAATLSLGSAQTAQAAPKAPVPAERKKGRVVINRSSAGVKNFAKQSVVDVPSVPSLPGSDYKKAGSAEPKVSVWSLARVCPTDRDGRKVRV